MEVANTIQPYEGEPRASKTVSLVRCSGQDRNKKLPLLNVQFVAFVFCFLWRNLCKEWVAVFVFVDVAFYSFALSAAKVPLGQCSRVSLLLSSKIAKADVVVVEPVKQKTSEFI